MPLHRVSCQSTPDYGRLVYPLSLSEAFSSIRNPYGRCEIYHESSQNTRKFLIPFPHFIVLILFEVASSYIRFCTGLGYENEQLTVLEDSEKDFNSKRNLKRSGCGSCAQSR